MAAPQKLTKEARIDRDQRIWRLRISGWTQEQIGREIGITDQAVARVLAKKRAEYREAHLEEIEAQVTDEAAALDESIRMWTERAQAGSYKAGELVLRYRESRRKLLGIDRPAKVDVSSEYVVKPVEVELAELYAQLGINDPTIRTLLGSP